MEFDITKIVEEITMQATENQEEFIFETIRPYCENILQMKINKEELKQILLNGIRKQQPNEDCVSRKSVVEWLERCTDDSIEHAIDSNLDFIPSVTPSYNSIKTELKPYEDWISRETAINTVVFECGEWTGLAKEISKQLRQLSSVTPQPKMGKWIKIKPYPLQMHDYECSECGHETDNPTENYCSECGAKMEVEEV